MHATLTLLGTGAALSDPHRTTTMLAVSAGPSSVLVDCGGDVVHRFLASGHQIDSLDSIILTHEHPDHVGGFPLFMEKIWLAGRRTAIPVYGPAAALSQARRAFDTFNTSGWDGLPRIEAHEVPLAEGAHVLTLGSLRILASPGEHGVPVIGLRFENLDTGGVVAYSCDTRPSEAITRLAADADLLIHEATGEGPNHTSIEQAARIAQEAGAKRLVLVHLPPGLDDDDLEEARTLCKATSLGAELEQFLF